VAVLESWDGGDATAEWSDVELVVTVPAAPNGAVRISYPTSALRERVLDVDPDMMVSFSSSRQPAGGPAPG